MWTYFKLIIGAVIMIYAIGFFVILLPFDDNGFFTWKDDFMITVLFMAGCAIGFYLFYTSLKKVRDRNIQR